MRISERYLTNSYLKNLNYAKESVSKLSEQMSAQTKISKPSDSPTGAAKVIRITKQMDQIAQYQASIAQGKEFITETTSAMDSMKENGVKIESLLAEIKNPVNSYSSQGYSQQIQNIFDIFMELANTKHEGKYLFGGTDSKNVPFSINSDGNVEINSKFIDGKQIIKVGDNLDQQVNISGSDIFKGFANVTGNLNMDDTNPQVITNKVSGLDGKTYTATATYTKTADNTFALNYQVKDGSTNIYTLNQSVEFDPTSGTVKKIDGADPKSTMVNVTDSKLKFVFDTSNLTAFSKTSNLKMSEGGPDIFNTLLDIKKMVANNQTVPSEYSKQFETFFQNLTDNMSKMGNIENKLTATNNLQDTQNLELTDLLSKTKDIDTAKSIVDLQNYEYILQLSYKTSSMISQSSIMDYI